MGRGALKGRKVVRSMVIATCAWFAAAIAGSTQEATPLPFAPPIPATFIIDESRTLEVEGVSVTAQARYSLELLSFDDSYSAVFTLLRLETRGIDKPGDVTGMALPSQSLVGFPINLTLTRSGNVEIRNAEAVRQRLNGSASEYPTYMRDPRLLASAVAAPLGIVEPCQDTSLAIGRPEHHERENAIDDTPFRSFFSHDLELRSVNYETGRAELTFLRTQGMREASGEAATLLHQLTIRIECTVDVPTGVVLHATAETTGPDDFSLRSVVTVSPE